MQKKKIKRSYDPSLTSYTYILTQKDERTKIQELEL